MTPMLTPSIRRRLIRRNSVVVDRTRIVINHNGDTVILCLELQVSNRGCKNWDKCSVLETRACDNWIKIEKTSHWISSDKNIPFTACRWKRICQKSKKSGSFGRKSINVQGKIDFSTFWKNKAKHTSETAIKRKLWQKPILFRILHDSPCGGFVALAIARGSVLLA